MDEEKEYVGTHEVLGISEETLSSVKTIISLAHKKADNVLEMRDHIYNDLAIKTDRDRELVATGFMLQNALIKIQIDSDPVQMVKILFGSSCAGVIEVNEATGEVVGHKNRNI
jgi:hypothetical protein